MPLDRRRDLLPTFLITIVLCGLGAYAIFNGRNEALGGGIVGYVAAYWLPAVRVHPESPGVDDG